MKRALLVLCGLLLSAPAYAVPVTWESLGVGTHVGMFLSSTVPRDSLDDLFSVGDPLTMRPTFHTEWPLTPRNFFEYEDASESFTLDITIGGVHDFPTTGGFANRLRAGDASASIEFKNTISRATKDGHWHLGLDSGVPVRHDKSVGQFTAVQAVPEPSTLLALSLGLVTMIGAQIRRRH